MKYDFETLLHAAMKAALKASVEIMKVYDDKGFSVVKKKDFSPITLADKKSHAIIFEELSKFSIPIISEEGYIPEYEERKKFDCFWLVDPLDGTKEFVNRNGQFAINIALIQGVKPVLGIIYIPVEGHMFYAYHSNGAYKWKIPVGEEFHENYVAQSERLPNRELPKNYSLVASRSHKDTLLTEKILELERQYPDIEILSVGSSIKWCMIAEGKAHLYLRYSTTMEWDTASGQIIAIEAGCKVGYDGGKEFTYNKEVLRNKGFEVIRPI